MQEYIVLGIACRTCTNHCVAIFLGKKSVLKCFSFQPQLNLNNMKVFFPSFLEKKNGCMK